MSADNLEQLIIDRPFVMKTRNGIFIDVMNPNPDEILIDDIAWSLSNTIRFGGHHINKINVAQHSIDCYLLAKKYGWELEEQLHCLLHDGGEAYIGDIPTPIKRRMPIFEEIEEVLMNIIWDKYGVPITELYSKQIVKNIDREQLFVELRTFDIEQPCYDSKYYYNLFLEIYYDLINKIHEQN